MRETYSLAVRSIESHTFPGDWQPVDEHCHSPLPGDVYAVRNPDGILLHRNLTFDDALARVQRLRRMTQPKCR